MSIELVTKYSPYTDEQFSAESKKALLTNNDFDWTGAHTVKVYKITTGRMNDYSRSGPASGNWSCYGPVESLNAATEEFTLKKDRSFIFPIDKLDTEETQGQLAGASALARQMREVVIPEVDTYVYDVMCASAGTKPAAVILTADNIYTEILKGSEALDDAEVPETGRVIVVKPAVYTLMKKCKDIVMETDIGAEMRAKGILGILDGGTVVKVPAVRLPEAFGFMIAHPSATVAPTKLEEYSVHNDTVYNSGCIVTGRICYDAFTLDNKKKGIYYQAVTLAAGLTVTSAAGSVSGETAVTVSPAASSGNSYVYQIGDDLRTPAVSEECSAGWTTWNGTDEIEAQTGKTLLVVEIDSSNKAVKAGTATVIAKA